MWFLGAALSMFGSVNIQKYSFNLNKEKPEELQKKYFCQPLWVFGLSLVVLGAVADFTALSMTAQSIVAPIGSVTLVVNLVFAHFLLHERMSRRDLQGTVLIVIGSTLSVVFGNHDSADYTVEQLQEYYMRLPFVVYACLVIAFMITLFSILKKIEPVRAALNDAVRRYDKYLEAGDKELVVRQDIIIHSLEQVYAPWERIHPLCFCALSGTFGGQSITFGKMVAVLLSETAQGDNQMFHPLPYFFLLAMLVTVFSQLHFLAKGLEIFDALYVVPVFQCFFISFSTLGGAIYFGEFASFDVVQWFMFPLGFVITLAGVQMLSARSMRHEPELSPVSSADDLMGLVQHEHEHEYADESVVESISELEQGEEGIPMETLPVEGEGLHEPSTPSVVSELAVDKVGLLTGKQHHAGVKVRAVKGKGKRDDNALSSDTVDENHPSLQPAEWPAEDARKGLRTPTATVPASPSAVQPVFPQLHHVQPSTPTQRGPLFVNPTAPGHQGFVQGEVKKIEGIVAATSPNNNVTPPRSNTSATPSARTTPPSPAQSNISKLPPLKLDEGPQSARGRVSPANGLSIATNGLNKPALDRRASGSLLTSPGSGVKIAPPRRNSADDRDNSPTHSHRRVLSQTIQAGGVRLPEPRSSRKPMTRDAFLRRRERLLRAHAVSQTLPIELKSAYARGEDSPPRLHVSRHKPQYRVAGELLALLNPFGITVERAPPEPAHVLAAPPLPLAAAPPLHSAPASPSHQTPAVVPPSVVVAAQPVELARIRSASATATATATAAVPSVTITIPTAAPSAPVPVPVPATPTATTTAAVTHTVAPPTATAPPPPSQ